MKLSDFDFHLPKDLVAQEPMKPRDHSRLLVLDKKSGEIQHKHFFDLPDFLQPGDVLVLNNSKVFPARLIGKKPTGGKIEIFLHQKIKAGAKEIWQCLVGGRGAKAELEIEFDKKLVGKIVKNNNDGTWDIEFNLKDKKLMDEIYKLGKIPLPPYIKRDKNKKSSKKDIQSYQTVYASDNKIGSVAAPTAGFHFTPRLMKKLINKGIQIEYITLHVGLGTFAPVKTNDITKHQMHAEWVEIDKPTLKNIRKAKKENKRIIAVGTTSTRTLEAIYKTISHPKPLKASDGYANWVNIFIYPGYKFKIVDAMITNFHLPKSTLLMLVSSFTNKKNIDRAYRQAIKKKYRFYSYGDAMLIK